MDYIRGPPGTFRPSVTRNQGYDSDKVYKGTLCFSRVINDHTSGSDQRDGCLEFLKVADCRFLSTKKCGNAQLVHNFEINLINIAVI